MIIISFALFPLQPSVLDMYTSTTSMAGLFGERIPTEVWLLDRMLSVLRKPLVIPGSSPTDLLPPFLAGPVPSGSDVYSSWGRIMIPPRLYPAHFFRTRLDEEEEEYDTLLVQLKGGGISALSKIRLFLLKKRGYGVLSK